MVGRNDHTRILILYHQGLTPQEMLAYTPYQLHEIVAWHEENGYGMNRKTASESAGESTFGGQAEDQSKCESGCESVQETTCETVYEPVRSTACKQERGPSVNSEVDAVGAVLTDSGFPKDLPLHPKLSTRRKERRGRYCY